MRFVYYSESNDVNKGLAERWRWCARQVSMVNGLNDTDLELSSVRVSKVLKVAVCDAAAACVAGSTDWPYSGFWRSQLA